MMPKAALGFHRFRLKRASVSSNGGADISVCVCARVCAFVRWCVRADVCVRDGMEALSVKIHHDFSQPEAVRCQIVSYSPALLHLGRAR
jgi:hypothetical protein